MSSGMLSRRLALRVAGLLSLGAYRRLVRRDVVGFFYHIVADAPVPHVEHLYPHKSTREFERDLIYLRRHFTPVCYADLLAHHGGQRSLPHNAAFVSFDDGFAECWTVVRPLLARYNVPCIFFVPSDFIDNRRLFYRCKVSLCIERIRTLSPGDADLRLRQVAAVLAADSASEDACIRRLDGLQESDDATIDRVCALLGIDVERFLRERQPFLTRAQLCALKDAGFTLGAHGRRHTRLAMLPVEEQVAEIVESCRLIGELTGAESVPFAFPFSGDGVDRTVLAELRAKHRFVGLLFGSHHIYRDEPFIVNRIWADRPIDGVLPEQNLAYWLGDAYRQNVADRLSRALSPNSFLQLLRGRPLLVRRP